MNAVILFSHGSLLCGAGTALRAQADRLRARHVAPIVEIGYLNYSEPAFEETVRQVIDSGASHILVIPYFLVPGKFVKVDLPKAVATAQAAYTGVSFVIGQAIGFDTRLADALLAGAVAAVGPAGWREDLDRATQYCRPNPECPLYGTHYCPKAPGDKPMGGLEAAQTAVHPETLGIDNVARPSSAVPSVHAASALLIMVHGSPRPIANAEMFRVVEVIKERNVFPIVEVGFMECNEPSIPDAIAHCVEQGASSITAVPYFLHTGTHVADDLPTLIEEGCLRYPNISFRMGEYLGRSEHLTDILATRIYTELANQS